jgi:prolipoprotein diacylglyceryltransferase
MYWNERFRRAPGLIFGSFLILIFGSRFFVEFFKEVQVAFEQSLPLDMGQLLSIPLVVLGVALVVRARKMMANPEFATAGAGGAAGGKKGRKGR